MKHNILKYLTLSLGALLAIACSNTEENLFEESASARIEKNREMYKNALESPADGWLFQYYPHPEQKFGGFNYVVTFRNDTVTAEMTGLAIKERSLYTVLNRGGNVLSFNLFNTFLHAHAAPSGFSPKGRQGDFEFLILNQKGDTINLKGLRTGNYMRLIKIKENTADLKSQIESNFSFIEKATLIADLKGTPIQVSRADNVFTLRYTNDDNQPVTETAPFIATKTGFELYKPITIKDTEIQKLILNKTEKTLTSPKGDFTINVLLPPIDLNSIRWNINMDTETGSSAKMKEAFLKVAAADKAKWGETLDTNIWFGYCFPRFAEVGISFKSITPDNKAYRAHYNLFFSAVLGHEDYIQITPIEAGYNWKYYTHLLPYVAFIVKNSPYKVEVDNASDPHVAKLTSTVDREVWFTISR